ncbi:MAG TPA: PAS domain S-box protein [Nitrospirota bacterium]|nr:PAS domain S-box protein [Nitrospirota bacterium]
MCYARSLRHQRYTVTLQSYNVMILQILNPDNYQFTFFALAVFLIGVSIAMQGLFVLIRERLSLVGLSFLLLCLNIGLYLVLFSGTFASPTMDISVALFWSKIANLGVIWIPSSILLLVTVLAGLQRRYRLAIIVSAAASAAFSIGLIFTDLFIRRMGQFSWGKYSQYGPLGYAFVGYFCLVMVLVVRLLWKAHRHAATDRQRKRYRGLLIAFIGGYISSVDFLPAFGISLFPFGAVFIGFFIAATTHVVLRYRLVDITPELAASQILETMQGAVIVTDLEGTIRVINEVALEMIGSTRPEMLGQNITGVLSIPKDLIESVKAGAKPASREMVWQGNSHRHVVNVSASLLRDKLSGQPGGVVYVAADITHLRRAEAALRESEERFRHMFENFQVVALVIDPVEDRILDANAAAAEFYGWSRNELRSKKISEITVTGPDAVQKKREPPVTGQRSYSVTRQSRADGSIRDVEVYSGPILTGGRPVLYSIVHDITDRKHAEEKIRSSEKFVRNILDTVDEGFIVVDRDFRILIANRAYGGQIGLSSDDVIGRHCYEVSHKTNRPCFEEGEECAVRNAVAEGAPSVALHKHTDAGGQFLFVETKAFPIKDDTGRVTSVIETLTNITEKHLLEEERVKTQKLEAIGTLAGGIAHDFNNLLQGIFGYISLARLKRDDREKSLDALEEAEKALHLSVRLTKQLLTFSKGGRPEKKKISLKPVIENAAKFALSGSRAACRIAIGELRPVEADEGQIGQVIQNMVLNADQAMPEGGLVEITAKNIHAPDDAVPQVLKPGDYVEIAVRDTGIGISDQYLMKIFDPYFTTKEKGSGLGLATSYSIINNHGGHIDVQSVVDKGTTFFIYLPAAEADGEKGPDASPPSAPTMRAGRILVMDDDQVVRTIAGELIKALGHEVDFAVHGEDAVEKYRRAKQSGAPFDVVILDLTIRGGMGGAQAVRELLKIDPAVKAVVSSGYSGDAIISTHADHGFRACLRKPYNVDQLREVLTSLLNA